MKKTLSLLAIILLFSCNNDNTNTQTNPPSKDASFILKEGDLTTLNNTFFKHYSYLENEEKITHLLKVKQLETISAGNEFTESKLEISSTEKNWKISSNAHNIDFKNNTIILEHLADFDHENTYSSFNIETGKHLLDYTYGNLTARIPSSNFKRYIGFVARSNSKELLSKFDKDVIGVLTYASDQNTIQKILVKSTSDIGGTTPSMEMVALSEGEQLYENNQLLYFMDLKPKYDPKDINFAFGLTFYIGEMSEESALLFEVKEDEISLKNTKYNTEVFQLKMD